MVIHLTIYLWLKGIGHKVALLLLKAYDTIENIYSEIGGLDKTDKEDLVKFFKESLGISRNPIKNY